MFMPDKNIPTRASIIQPVCKDMQKQHFLAVIIIWDVLTENEKITNQKTILYVVLKNIWLFYLTLNGLKQKDMTSWLIKLM